MVTNDSAKESATYAATDVTFTSSQDTTPINLQNISAKRVDSLAFRVLKSLCISVWISIIYVIFNVNTYIVP